MIRVGPESAGARPGPACYGLGGTRPTVTDANVVLGLIEPGDFLGGRMRLDREAAEAAVGALGDELGLGPVEAALTIHTACNHNMIAAIEDITVMEGINPRDSFLVAGGGAIGCHIGGIAAELGIKRFMVPRFAAGLSAFGGLISDIRWEEATTLFTVADDFSIDAVNDVLARMREAGRAFLDRAGVPRADQRFDYVVYGRYEFQSWEIEVPFATTDGRLATEDVSNLAATFNETASPHLRREGRGGSRRVRHLEGPRRRAHSQPRGTRGPAGGRARRRASIDPRRPPPHRPRPGRGPDRRRSVHGGRGPARGDDSGPGRDRGRDHDDHRPPGLVRRRGRRRQLPRDDGVTACRDREAGEFRGSES